MTRRRKTGSLVILLILAVLMTSACADGFFSYSYPKLDKSLEQMEDEAVDIIQATAEGSEVISIDPSTKLSFVLTTVRVNRSAKNAFKKDETLRILQTKDVPIDVPLKRGESYIIYLSRYTPGSNNNTKQFSQDYTILQAHKGMFRISNHDVIAYGMDGSENRQDPSIDQVKSQQPNLLN